MLIRAPLERGEFGEISEEISLRLLRPSLCSLCCPPPIQTGLHVCVAGFDLQEHVTKENPPLEFKFVLALVVR